MVVELGGQDGAAMEWLRKGKKGLTVLENLFLLVRSRCKVAWPGLLLTQVVRPPLHRSHRIFFS